MVVGERTHVDAVIPCIGFLLAGSEGLTRVGLDASLELVPFLSRERTIRGGIDVTGKWHDGTCGERSILARLQIEIVLALAPVNCALGTSSGTSGSLTE